MKRLVEFLDNKNFENLLLEETVEVMGENTLINEAFQVDILKRLAAKIKEWESETRQRDVERQKQNDAKGYGKIQPNAKTFTSMFGPIVKYSRWGNDTQKVRGVKWDKITDDNVTFYEGGYDSALHKRIKKMFSGKIRGMIIACDPDTDDIVYVVRGFTSTDSNGKLNKPSTWQFDTYKKYDGSTGKNLKNVTSNAYKYRTRDLNADELIEAINDYNIYFIELPESLIDEYNTLIKDRKEAMDGVINYDKESLAELAAKQRARYKQLAKELRAKRLAENPEYLLNEITKVNDEVLALYKEIISKPEYVDKYLNIGNAMSYVTYAYESYYDYVKSMRRAENEVAAMKKWAEEKPDEVSDKELERAGRYDRNQATEKLEETKQRINRVRQEMDDIRKRMKE